jgi:Holliday junction resolvase RusA-like endonuclease
MPRSYLDYRDSLRLMMRRGRGEWRPDRAATFAVKLLCYRDSRRRVDVDNLLKTVLDAGTGILWHDDSSVVKANVARLLDRENPRLELRVWRAVREQQQLEVG